MRNTEKNVICKNQKQFLEKIPFGQQEKGSADNHKRYKKEYCNLLIVISIVQKAKTKAKKCDHNGHRKIYTLR